MHGCGCVAWRVLDAVATRGDVIAIATNAESLERDATPRERLRLQNMRVVRDYRTCDPREAPQLYCGGAF